MLLDLLILRQDSIATLSAVVYRNDIDYSKVWIPLISK